MKPREQDGWVVEKPDHFPKTHACACRHTHTPQKKYHSDSVHPPSCCPTCTPIYNSSAFFLSISLQTLCFSNSVDLKSIIQSSFMLLSLRGIFPLNEMPSCMSSWKYPIWLLKPGTDIASSSHSDSDFIGLGYGLSIGTFKCYSGDNNMHQSLRVTSLGQCFSNSSKHQSHLGGGGLELQHRLQG